MQSATAKRIEQKEDDLCRLIEKVSDKLVEKKGKKNGAGRT